MKIRELLDRDPLATPLANSGQARLTSGEDAKVVAELRGELETFVCEGQFADALQRILERYNANLDGSRQDSAWVSGFFGSGKSHLLKMLAHLWANTAFEDGVTARGLVLRGLPQGVEAALRELDVRAKRTGKPAVAAAGSLLGGNVDHVRLAVLSILLRACGWPTQYPQARFCFWLREEGLLDRVRDAVEATGRMWARELNNLYVSPVLAGEILAAKPDFAADVKTARQLLASQFPPPKTDITTEQFVAAAKQALTPNGELPLTIIVLDEVQQYVHEAQDRSATITELAEALQTQFSSRVLLVAAGQSALSAGIPALQWLSDRFRIAVQLSDAEVEVVTRHVLLHKKTSTLPDIREMLESNSGEVSRHLQGTKLEVRSEDHRYDAEDYPLLRTRRRFWEACFQAADQAGTHGQLRSQLRILHDSLRNIARRDIGAVIPTSDLYHALAPDLVNSGVLPNEIHTRIAKLAEDGTTDGALRRDLCGVVFLIGKLPREGAANLGVRADASTLADLLVDDVSADSGPFRNRVAEALEEMASEGILLKVAREYRLQTRAGADWELALRRRRTALTRQEVDIARLREQLLGAAVQEVVSGIRVRQGEAKLPRKLTQLATEPEAETGDAIQIWRRDEWSCSWTEAEGEARRRGMEDPVLHVHLPKRNADQLQAHLVEAEAARQVLDERGVPDSVEGREACESMRSRLNAAEDARDGIVREIVRAARVLQGGGGELHGEDLRSRLEAGIDDSLARLYPRFPDADHRSWNVAFRHARDGGDQPFGIVGWNEAVSRHPVAREVLDAVGAGNRGGAVRKKLTATPYGWPKDAVDAALVALHGGDHLKATRNGQTLSTKQLDQKTINTTDFRPEKVQITVAQRTKIRGLYRLAGVSAKSGDEAARAADFLASLRKLASEAGGDAPLPAAPQPAWLDDLGRLTGNEQLLAVFNEKGQIKKAVQNWTDLAERARERRPLWELATALHGHATGELDVAEQVGEQLDAIRSQRSLLDETDHVSPCVAKLSAGLRAALTERREDLTQAVVAETERLDQDAIWTRLEGEARDTIQHDAGLAVPDPLPLDTSEALRRALDARRLSAWRSDIDAVPARASKALAEAARRVSPKESVPSVTVRRGTLQDETAVREWLDEHHRKLTEAVQHGPVIVE